MDPERGALESLLADTDLEASGQQRLSSWEMHQTTVDDCLLVDGSLYLGEPPFSLEDFIIRVPDNRTITSFSSSKNRFLQMSCKPEDTKELANQVVKQFDHGGLREEPPL